LVQVHVASVGRSATAWYGRFMCSSCKTSSGIV